MASRRKTRAGIAIIWVALLGLGLAWTIGNDVTLAQVLRAIQACIAANAFAVVAFVLFYSLLRPLIFLPSMWLAIVAGSLFGFWPGVIVSLIGENLSASAAYAIARYFRGTPAEDDLDRNISKFRYLLHNQAFPTVLVMRTAYLPFDPVNYGCGLLRVPWWPYFFGTLIGTLVPTITFVSFGASVDLNAFVQHLDEFRPTALLDKTQLAISLLLFVISGLIAWFAYRRQRQLHSVAKSPRSPF